MDSFRGFEDEPDFGPPAEEEAVIERPPEIGTDERRMHVRAYNYWVSLLDGRPFPSINDVDPHTIEDFGAHSVLLDFSTDPDNPEIAFLGRELREECSIGSHIGTIGEVPARSLLSRLTDHYLQIIANRAPIGFEAEFVGQGGKNMVYRGILMPLSSNDEVIDFIYGVINWKEVAESELSDHLAAEVDRAISAAPAPAPGPVWADGPHSDFDAEIEEEIDETEEDAEADHPTLWSEQAEAPGDDAGLGDRLATARESAEAARAGEERSRSVLYRALGLAYDFALAAEADPEGYAELLADSGLTVQARAPMTPIVKLVFGAGYDKTRLAEFAAALAWAARRTLDAGALADTLEALPGGLKAAVREERQARRPTTRPDRWAEIRRQLQTAPPLACVDIVLPEDAGEIVLLIARREGERTAILAPVTDPRLIDQAIRKAG